MGARTLLSSLFRDFLIERVKAPAKGPPARKKRGTRSRPDSPTKDEALGPGFKRRRKSTGTEEEKYLTEREQAALVETGAQLQQLLEAGAGGGVVGGLVAGGKGRK